MDEFATWLLAFVADHPAGTYLFLVCSSYLENIFPPFPGDMMMVFGGYLVGRDGLSFAGAFASTFAGHTAGFMTLYYLGRRLGREALLKIRWIRNTEPWIDRAEAYALRYGAALIVLNRFLPGIRSVISIAVGLLRMRWWTVLLSAVLSISTWNALLLYGGRALGQNWEHVARLLNQYNLIVGGVVILAVATGMIWYRVRRRTLG